LRNASPACLDLLGKDGHRLRVQTVGELRFVLYDTICLHMLIRSTKGNENKQGNVAI